MMKQAFKRWLLSLALLASFWPMVAAAGQMTATEPVDVALAFYKLAGETPDFIDWAKKNQEYRRASGPEQKQAVLQRIAGELEQKFSLLDPSKTVLVFNATVHISDYDPEIQGVTITSFKKGFFFPVDYLDQHFGVLPKDMADVQKIKMPEASAQWISERTKGGLAANIELQLIPVTVLDEPPSEYHSVKYWPLKTKLKNIRIWSMDNREMLWDDNPDGNNKLKDIVVP